MYSSRSIVQKTAHRPYPLPPGPWIMAQSWHDLLFAHWEIDPGLLGQLLPSGLTPDLYEGRAYIAVVPFRMSGIRPRMLPAVPWLSAFPELNVRTYAKCGDQTAVYFFSLEAANPVAVALARAWFHLPYFNARMSMRENDERIVYQSDRTHRGAPAAQFAGTYGPTGPVYQAQPGTLEHWLTERYRLFSTDRRGRIYSGEIHHVAWPLQPAFADIQTNTMTECHGIPLPEGAPLLHFARRIDVVVWNPTRIA